MIARHYKELTRQKVIHPAHCLLPEKEILSVYGDSAAGVLTENTPDPLGAVDLRRFKACWPDIRRIVAGLPGEQELTDLIQRAGGAYLPEQVHVSPEQARSALRFGRYTRRRLTLLRLSDLLS